MKSWNPLACAALIAAVLAILQPERADARCTCTCVNGSQQALCESAAELPPLCPPRLCPLESPSVAPLPQPQLPPLGTTHCEQAQVLNPQTGIYEWRQVCR